MKISIIVFSPSGHTLKVAQEMQTRLEKGNQQVQIIDVTRKIGQMEREGYTQYFEKRVDRHDCLCIGSPVYAGHFEQNALRIIKALPAINSKWGALAIPFITYGGLHSSIALREAGNMLYKKGRKNIMGIKIGSFHTLSTTLNNQINFSHPNDNDLKVLDDVLIRIKKINTTQVKDNRKSFSYVKLIERILFTLLSQNFFHKKNRNNAIDSEKCSECGLCAKICPVGAIEKNSESGGLSINSKCILCAECFHKCPNQAITFSYIDKIKNRLEKITPREIPQSQIYPA